MRWELLDPSGRVRFSSVCEDWGDAGQGLWLPRKITATNPDVVHVYEVLKAAVNVPIPEADLDLTFPPGTFVDDRISGRRYEADQTTTAPATTGPAPTQGLKSGE